MGKRGEWSSRWVPCGSGQLCASASTAQYENRQVYGAEINLKDSFSFRLKAKEKKKRKKYKNKWIQTAARQTLDKSLLFICQSKSTICHGVLTQRGE